MRVFLVPLILFVCGIGPARGAATDIAWRELEPGFELAEYTPDPGVFQSHTVVVLRIDPLQAEFVLLNASEEGAALSLRGWADRASLLAAINASMYLPDALTSTGYMRGPIHTNNPRVVNKFGAFFVASPRELAERKAVVIESSLPDVLSHEPFKELPSAAILDRDADPWEQQLKAYNIVIQNYRLINAEGRILWAPGGPSYAVSAIGADKSGRILFLHCREPLTGEDFARLLLEMQLNVRVVMYVEGGPQAGLLVRAGTVDSQWMGRHVVDFLTSGNKNAPLPNVLGVRRRAAPQK